MTIGQLAKKTGYSKDTIRYYEKIGLITPAMYRRQENGYKHYAEQLVPLLEMVTLAKYHGFTLPELKNYLARLSGTRFDCRLIAPMLIQKLAEVDQKIETLQRQKKALQDGLKRIENECA